MTTRPQPAILHVDWWWWVGLMGALYFLLAFVVGPLALGGALYWRTYYPNLRNYVALLFSLAWVLLLWGQEITPLSTAYWLWSLPLTPLAVEIAGVVAMFRRFSRPRSLEEQVREDEELIRYASNQRERMRAQRAEHMPVPGSDSGATWLNVGIYLRGDLLPEGLHIRERGNWLQLEEGALDHHLFVLGATGSGKTETLKRLVSEIFEKTQRSVYLVDGKGEKGLSQYIRALSFQHGRGLAPIFKLGQEIRGAMYDGFRGDADVIYNRLLTLIGTDEAEGNAQYFADRNRTILGLAVKAPGHEPPRTLREVIERIDRSWLDEAYRGDALMRRRIKNLDKRHAIDELNDRLFPLYQDFDSLVNPHGFALENTRCAIFSIRTLSVKDSASRLLEFLVEDFKDFIGKRQSNPGVLIIDEFGAFNNDNILALLTLARSAKMGVILATQDMATLKDPNTAKVVLANTLTKILMRTDFPEEMVEFAGTRFEPELSAHILDGAVGDEGSVRLQHNFKIKPNDVPKLGKGEAYVISMRYESKIKVQMVEGVMPVADQESQWPPEPKKSAPQAPPGEEQKQSATGAHAEKPHAKKVTTPSLIEEEFRLDDL